jgi:hypothetical protein
MFMVRSLAEVLWVHLLSRISGSQRIAEYFHLMKIGP